MNKVSFGRAALKISKIIHDVLMFSLLIGPAAAVGIGPHPQEDAFFQRYLLAPIIVLLVILMLVLMNTLLAALIRRITS